MNQVAVAIICGLIILVGFVATILPFLPGPPLALIGLILFAWLTGWKAVSVVWIVIFCLLIVLTVILDTFGPALIARGYQATKWGMWGTVIGGLLGLFILGPLGAFVGPFIGAFIGEIFSHQDSERAWKAAWGAFVGIILGTLFKFIVSFVILVYFILALFRTF